MSLGGIVGGVVGGVVGSFFGPAGAIYGASIGFAIGMAIDPITPDMPSSGAPMPEQEVMKSTVGDPCPDLAGTIELTGHLIWDNPERSIPVYSEPAGGGKGGPPEPEPQIVGYEYYKSWALGFCRGPVDKLHALYKNDDSEALFGDDEGAPVARPASGGEETLVIENFGSVTFYFGTADQIANTKLGALLENSNYNTPYRYYCWAYFDDCKIGGYPRTPTIKAIVQKTPEYDFTSNSIIATYECNPANIIYYALNGLTGLPTDWLDSTSFGEIAETLYTESRGMCVKFADQNSCLSYLTLINSHIDNILRYGSDAKFHPKLLRDDYDVDTIPSINEDDMLDDPSITPKSWIDTINEMKVQYTQLIGGDLTPDPSALPLGRWVAELEEKGTKYIYFYIQDTGAVIRVDTSSSTEVVVVDYLVINEDYTTYTLDIYGGFASQQGGYAMSKNYNKIWYLFRNTSGDVKLVEVDITSARMVVTKETIFLGVLETVSFAENIKSACGVDSYAFFATSNTSGRILKFDTDHNKTDKTFSYPAGESINSITINVLKSQIFWIRNQDSGPACLMSISDFNFNYTWGPYAEVDGGLDSANWQNFIVYDEFTDTHFRQRVYWPANGVAYYYSKWEPNIGRAYIQNLQYMKQYLGGNAQYFYVLHQDNSGLGRWLHRFTHQDSTVGGAVAQINLRVDTWLAAYEVYNFVSIYNRIANRCFLVQYNSSNGRNYVNAFNSSLTNTFQSIPDTIYWGSEK